MEAALDAVAAEVTAGGEACVLVEQAVEGGSAGGHEAVKVAGTEVGVVQMRFDHLLEAGSERLTGGG